MSVRVRFAPSPTGELTVGGLRSSLFNYLLARHHGGTFVLRLEDTDRSRLTPGAFESLLEAHRWLGIMWDEGPEVGGPYAPYFQSERLDLYRAYIDRLIAGGHAYRCYCSEERLERLRAEQRARRQPTRYDRRCRSLSAEERAAYEAAGAPFVVRFAMPLAGETVLHDAIRGTITWSNATYDDHVLLKSDGYPTYHLAAIVDDIEMRITHVFRGEEWLPSTPRHLQLYYALGVEPPVFAHLPVVLGKDRKKLSKRHGDTSVRAYAEAGYLPDAMFNFLGLLGWSLDDKTVIISRQEFIEHFTIERIVKSPALFDLDKLNWLNQQYIQRLSLEELVGYCVRWLERDLPPAAPRPVDRERVRRIAEAVRTRITRFDEVAGLTWYLFVPGPLPYDTALLLGKRGEGDPVQVAATLRLLREHLARVEPWERTAIEALFDRLVAEHGLKKGALLMPLRVACSGGTVSLPMDVTLEALGRSETLARIDDALRRLAELPTVAAR